MITDIFYKRYPHIGYHGGGVPKEIHVLFRQGAQILLQDLKPYFIRFEAHCREAYDKLLREIGHGIYDGRSAEEICIGALCETYDLWNNTHGSSHDFISYRLSLIELIISELEKELVEVEPPNHHEIMKFLNLAREVDNVEKERAFREATRELNIRFWEAGLPFQYHNGILQFSEDSIVERQIYEPFWNIVKDPKYKNVDIDIKEAIDRRDSNSRDAVFYALKALESTIKIMSDEMSFTRGTERGAANYIDNLVSSANGRFIDVWEADLLKKLFSELRNPYGHGPGLSPQPTLKKQQEDWAIENSISWIKSLVNRT